MSNNIHGQELCEIFSVQGKISGYKEEYNGFQLFKNLELMKDFINYGLQDSVALYNSLAKAQELYFGKYNVDITSVVSLPSLALKIFRLKFLPKAIPLMHA